MSKQAKRYQAICNMQKAICNRQQAVFLTSIILKTITDTNMNNHIVHKIHTSNGSNGNSHIDGS